nr:hypothetical protein [Clostridium botulinum]
MFSIHTIEKFLNEDNKLAIATILMIALSATLTMLIISFTGSLAIKNL